jgi:hypothetical protein
MKANTQQLLRDLKVAIALGNPEAVDIALDGMLVFPGISANDPLDEVAISRLILPVGEVLKPLPTPQLRPLLGHPLAAGRAVGGVALAHQFVGARPDWHATQKDLRKPATDPRPDVRISLGKALFHVAHQDSEKVLQLGTLWLMNAHPRLRHTALNFLPALGDVYGKQLIGLLGPVGIDADYEVRKALVEALTLLAMEGQADSVLALLTLWSTEKHPNAWVICRTVSGSWAVAHPVQVQEILQTIKSQLGETSDLTNAIKALDRRGVTIQL